ncbi:MAG: type 4a pilus biogenesis protein PilO [Planctomycetes bacterium]|nr:type 4a pilus biogenesis protein PilO [Planctomycetota bacterium]
MHAVDPNRRLRLLSWLLNGLGALAAVAIVVTVQFLVFRPLDARLAAFTRRTQQLERLLSMEEKSREEHARLRKELTAAREQATLVKDRIPDEPREAEFMAQVSELAGESDVTIQDYRPGTVIPKGAYSTMRVDLVCEGNHEGICGIVDGLRELPRHSTVDRLEIDSQEAKEKYALGMRLGLYVANPIGPDRKSE